MEWRFRLVEIRPEDGTSEPEMWFARFKGVPPDPGQQPLAELVMRFPRGTAHLKPGRLYWLKEAPFE